MESSSSESEDGDEQVERDEREENKGNRALMKGGLASSRRSVFHS